MSTAKFRKITKGFVKPKGMETPVPPKAKSKKVKQ